jgi:molybdopterin-containing oxidoreductase family iron-sulfur binding subunit
MSSKRDQEREMPAKAPSDSSRRAFLKAMATSGAAGYLAGCGGAVREAFFRQHFKELSAEDLADRVGKLEAGYRDQYGVDVEIDTQGPMPGVVFGYALDLSRCIGCRRCVHACVEENNQSRDPEIQYIRVLEMEKTDGVNLHAADHYYEADKVPSEGHFYMPVACQMCEDSPCEKVCPVGATWREPDGIVVVDYDWCIGCRFCMASCPYEARKFNWAEPYIPKDKINPKTHYLGNRPRMKGVVEKCHFCIQRTRKGLYPACVEICPVGARKFGNLLDPDSEIRYILENKRVFILKEELDTKPKFFYFFGL